MVITIFRLLLLILFTGCASYQKPYIPLTHIDRQALIASIKEFKAISTIRAAGSLEILSDNVSRYKGRVIVVAKLPSLFRIEFLNLLNQPEAVLTGSGKEYSFYHGGNLYRGEALPPQIPLSDLQHLPFFLIGWSNIRTNDIAEIRHDPDSRGDVYIIDMNPDDGMHHRVWLKADEGIIILRRDVYDNSGNVTTMLLEEYTENMGIKFPSRIKITSNSLNMVMRYGRVEINSEVDEALFSL